MCPLCEEKGMSLGDASVKSPLLEIEPEAIGGIALLMLWKKHGKVYHNGEMGVKIPSVQQSCT